MNTNDTASRIRGVRILTIAFVLLFVVLAGIALVIYFGLGSRPSHWVKQQERLATMTIEQKKITSENLRNNLLTQWSDPGKEAVRSADDLFGRRSSVEIPYEDLNIWLAEEGIELLADIDIKLPAWVKSAMVDSAGDGLLRITCEIERDKNRQVVALSFAIQVASDGTVTSTLTSAALGVLPVPTGTAIDLIASRNDPDSLMLSLTQGTPVGPIELPIDASDNGRDGRLVGLEVRDDALVVTRETVRRRSRE